MNSMFLGCVVLAAMSAVILSDGTNCTSSCKGYSACSSLVNVTNHTSFLNNSLTCSSSNDKILGLLFSNFDSCKLKEAAIEVADLMGVSWDGVSAVEALIEDQEFWLPKCEFEHLAAAACLYFSLPDPKTCANTPLVEKNKMFCKGECMKIASSCMNLGKYRQFNASVTSFCNDHSSDGETNCYKAQFDQSGLQKPNCNSDVLKAKSLTGPYIVGIVALVLAVVALIGLILITCRNNGGGGAPNSF